MMVMLGLLMSHRLGVIHQILKSSPNLLSAFRDIFKNMKMMIFPHLLQKLLINLKMTMEGKMYNHELSKCYRMLWSMEKLHPVSLTGRRPIAASPPTRHYPKCTDLHRLK